MWQCKIEDPAFALSTDAGFKNALLAKMLCVPYHAYVFSKTKSEITAEQDLPGTEWVGEDEGGGQDGEMTQTMYAHVNNVNKWTTIKKKTKERMLKTNFKPGKKDFKSVRWKIS
jgi:hypothetical protein